MVDLLVSRAADLRNKSVERTARGRARARARYEVRGRIAGRPAWAWPNWWSTELSNRVDALIARGEVLAYPEQGRSFLATRTGPDLQVVLTLARALDVIERLRVGQVSIERGVRDRTFAERLNLPFDALTDRAGDSRPRRLPPLRVGPWRPASPPENPNPGVTHYGQH